MIPKILHVLWIGPKRCPMKHIMTWKMKNPEYEFMFWNEEKLNREMSFRCLKQINDITQICGQCDIMRWEILYKYGGIFVDADSVCIEPIDDSFLETQAFSVFENEIARPSLLAIGFMGFEPNHPLCRDIIDWIADPSLSEDIIRDYPAWMSVGNLRLSAFVSTKKYNFVIFPSHIALPIHHTGITYEGHAKVFAHQLWGSSNDNYDDINDIVLPKQFTLPSSWLSIIISSHNTTRASIVECLSSIKNQVGWFGIELIWINRDSDQMHTDFLKEELADLEKSSRYITFRYHYTKKLSIDEAVQYGMTLCSHELIVTMDPDTTISPDQMLTLFHPMIEPEIVEENDLHTIEYHVIHMLDNIDRKQNIHQNIEKLNRDIVIFAAIPGKDVDAFAKKHPYITLVPDYMMTTNEIGCYLSHFTLLGSLKNSTSDYCVIFEDDFNIGDDFKDELTKIIHQMNDVMFDILYLGNNVSNHGLHYKDNIFHVDKERCIYGLHGYVIRTASIKKIYDQLYRVDLPIDVKLKELINRYRLMGFVLHPSIVTLNETLDSIIGHRCI